MSAPVLVCFALAGEARPFQRFAQTRADIIVVITGMGTKNAEAGLRGALARARPAHVFTCGVAGALDATLNIGDVVYQSSDAEIAARLDRAGARRAAFHCSERIVITSAEKAAARSSTNAAAVEMESGVIAGICAREGLACTIVRAISDHASEDLPLDFNRLLDAKSRMSPVKLATAIARAPWKIPALMRLGRNSALAARRLAQVLESVL